MISGRLRAQDVFLLFVRIFSDRTSQRRPGADPAQFTAYARRNDEAKQ
jgi:hypothetical protein